MKKTNKNFNLSSRDAKKLTVALVCVLLTCGVFLTASPFLLVRALESHNEGGVTFLLACGARTDFTWLRHPSRPNAPLLVAVNNHEWNAARRLIERGANVNDVDIYNYTPLDYAVLSAHTDTVRLLIQRGANVNYRVGAPYSPLVYAMVGLDASSQKRNDADRLETVRLLLEAGAAPNNATAKPGEIFTVARKSFPPAVPLLVAAGAKP